MRALIGILAILLLVGTAMAVPVRIDSVEVDDVVLLTTQTNRFDVTRDNEIEVEVLLTATANIDDIQLEAFMSGFEYNDVAPMSASTKLFSLDVNETKRFVLPIKLNEDVEEDNYKLRIMVSDRDGTVTLQNYNLKIDVDRHDLKIEDIVFTPSGSVTAGQALLATVRVENQGEKDEQDVRVDVAIPALELSGSDYLDEVEANDEEETEEIFMRVPLCAQSGAYDAEVTLTFDEGHQTERRTTRVTVMENPQCEETKKKQETVEVVVAAQAQPLEPAEPVKASKSTLRSVLETLVLILVGLLIIVVLVIGFNKLKKDDEEEY
ncbi:MAG TPA: hypothetical protein VJH22_07615 [Candidatus Nanoarchaeia archaeon]|nr:hypothetical protein [Candidatus Nanoarchaeia archaeon]